MWCCGGGWEAQVPERTLGRMGLCGSCGRRVGETCQWPADGLEMVEELCLDRVLSQGQLVTNQIHRCLPVALSGLKGGRAARRKLQDTVQVCLPISNVALEVLNNYCKVTGKTKAVVVTEIILATALVTETDHLSARAYFTRDQRICEYWNQDIQEECEYRWIVERIERELEEEYGTL